MRKLKLRDVQKGRRAWWDWKLHRLDVASVRRGSIRDRNRVKFY